MKQKRHPQHPISQAQARRRAATARRYHTARYQVSEVEACDYDYYDWYDYHDEEYDCDPDYGLDLEPGSAFFLEKVELRASNWQKIYSELLPPQVLRNWAKKSEKRLRNEPRAVNSRLLAKSLYSYLEQLIQKHNNARRSVLLRALGDYRNFAALRAALTVLDCPELLAILCLLSPFWVRSPHTWNGKDSLFVHLFIIYDIPPYLRQLFSDYSLIPQQPIKWLLWLIVLGQGASLRRAARYFDWQIPTGFQSLLYEFAEEPADDPVAICFLAEILRLGGNEIDRSRIADHHILIADPTAVSCAEFIWPNQAGELQRRKTTEKPRSFTAETIRWVIAHRDEMTDEECDRILQWAIHCHNEARRERPFSWRGRTVRSALNASNAYHRQLEQMRAQWGAMAWEPQGWNWEWQEEPFAGWSLRELTTGQALFDEGNAMHHCVGGYIAPCAAGRCAILSLRFRGERVLTIEVNLYNNLIVQVGGKYNRPATSEEMEVISSWLVQMACKDRDYP